MPKREHLHFIGIGGTAMGSVASALAERSITITGSDEALYPPMADLLREKGLKVFSPYGPGNLPEGVDAVVVGNAISRGNPELEAVLEAKIPYLSLPETIARYFLHGKANLVVTGTHGKTTTSSMLAWLLSCDQRDPSYMIGGLPRNFPYGAHFTDSPWVVLEGDEYDTAFFDKRSKFLHYLPEVVVINNIEFDHADIYSSLDEIKLSFRRLVNLVPRTGLVVVNGDDPHACEVAESSLAPVIKVGLGSDCDRRIESIDFQEESSEFTLGAARYQLPMNGLFNVRNAAMALTVGEHIGIGPEIGRRALSNFRGVARRQDLRGERAGVKVFDDFAHHPTAIAQALEAMRQRFPQARLWAIFEPRSNTTRRAIFQEELPQSLSQADGVYLAPIARVEQLAAQDRLDLEKVVTQIRSAGKEAFAPPSIAQIGEQLLTQLESGDVVITFSNGGFEGIHQLLLEGLEKKALSSEVSSRS